ncbi:MAG: hypothetical protein OIN89_00930 [Candidatus Methanoperedens sp.]|jgi:hypothetical protein|nr:hypothetical protein [Candidatus Methanoperedens sp.]
MTENIHTNFSLFETVGMREYTVDEILQMPRDKRVKIARLIRFIRQVPDTAEILS